MKEKGFKIPDNYFEHKKSALLNIANTDTEVKEGSSIKKLYPWLAAASVVLFAWAFWPQDASLDSSVQIESISDEKLVEFLSEDPFAVYPESFFYGEDSLNTEGNLLDDLDLESIESYLESNSHEYL